MSSDKSLQLLCILPFGMFLLSLVASSNNLEVHMFLVSRFYINHVMKLFHSFLIVLLYY